MTRVPPFSANWDGLVKPVDRRIVIPVQGSVELQLLLVQFAECRGFYRLVFSTWRRFGLFFRLLFILPAVVLFLYRLQLPEKIVRVLLQGGGLPRSGGL